MKNISFEDSTIEGVKKIFPFLVEDDRGYFLKSFEKDIFENNGIKTEIYETFESRSKKGVIRGLHFQTDHPQAKIVRCVEGVIWDVVVDLRKDSETKGMWCGFLLDARDNLSIYIPAGCAHGFISLSDWSKMTYTCSGKYSSGTDSGIIWNDETLKVAWPIDRVENILLSSRDSNLQTYEEFLRKNSNGL